MSVYGRASRRIALVGGWEGVPTHEGEGLRRRGGGTSEEVRRGTARSEDQRITARFDDAMGGCARIAASRHTALVGGWGSGDEGLQRRRGGGASGEKQRSTGKRRDLSLRRTSTAHRRRR